MMKKILFLLIVSGSFCWEMPGCDSSKAFDPDVVYYLHQLEISGPYGYVKMPTAWYQLKLKSSGQVDSNGIPVSFPEWEGLGLCLLDENGMMVPYNLSGQLYPQWKFVERQGPDIALDGVVREHAIYQKYVIAEQPDEFGNAVWLDEGFYQNGAKLNNFEPGSMKNFRTLYKIEQFGSSYRAGKIKN
jgi:hypothetical protein